MFKRVTYTAITLCIVFTISSFSHLFAQKQGNIWYFGEYAGINFNSGSPVPLGNSAMFQYDGCATISDDKGKLLFYTNGLTIWNKNHQVMDNGNGLHGGYPSTQSSVIVQKPLSDSIYYVFTVDDVTGPQGLKYSIVSMNRSSGLGSVISKNNPLLTPTTEKVTAIKHRNDTSVWVITHGWDTTAFFAYRIDSAGLNTTPIVSNVGVKHGGSLSKAAGYLKASPDGKKLALAIQSNVGVVEILKFDDSSGVVSDANTITSIKDPYGIEFSPDGTKLYVTSRSYGEIYQFFLLAGTKADIRASKIQIGNSGSQVGAMQIAIDAKIYVARTSGYLGVIRNPNAYGAASKYKDNGVYLAGRKSKYGLPTFNQSYFFNPEFQYFNQCYGDTTKFIVSNSSLVDSVDWNFGDPTSPVNTSDSMKTSHYYTAAGDYEVGILIYLQTGKVDTINWTLNIHEKPKSDFTINDSTQCLNENSVFYLNNSTITNGDLSYIWSFGDSIGSVLENPYHTYSVEDTFDVGLIAISDEGCKDTTWKKMIVFPSPRAKFTMNDSAQCFDKNKYEFKNRTTISSGNLSYSWDFGDGSGTGYKNPVHTYTTADTFLVTLIATSNIGCKDTVEKIAFVHIHPTPISAFAIDDSFQCFDDNHFKFTNNSYLSSGTMSYKWLFDDGDSSLLSEPDHIYSLSGNYDVSLVVTSNWGCKSKLIHKAYVNPEPRAAFEIDDTTQCLRDNTAKFTNKTHIDFGAVNYVWDFGDGFTSNLTSPDHQYATHDTFQISMIVSSTADCHDTAYGQIFIYPMPLVDFRINDNTQCLSNNSFQFIDESTISPGIISEFNWDAGDGYTSNVQHISHSYTQDGSYDVKLALVSDFGCRDSLIKKVFVFPMPDAGFSINDDRQCLNDNFFVCIDSSTISSGTINSYLWDMNDGKTYVQSSAYHNYANPGTYNIKYKVTSNQGCEDSIVNPVLVYPMPDVKFEINDDDQCINGNSFVFLDKTTISSGTLKDRLWDLDDGTQASTNNVTHHYNAYNTYKVKLKITSAVGCIDSLVQNVSVNPMPDASFIVDKSAQCLNGNLFNFSSSSTIPNGIITVNYWKFGDGGTSSVPNTSHSYLNDNTFTVKLRVSSQKGCSDSTSSAVIVYPMPVAAFSISNACLDENTNFTDETTINNPDMLSDWDWKIDGVSFSNAQNPQNMFSASGVYRIDLDVNSNHNCKDQTFDFVRINEHVSQNQLIRASVLEKDQILLEWTPSLTGSPSKYLIQRSSDGISYAPIIEKSASANSHIDKSVNTSDVSYSYRIQVTDSCDYLTPYTNIGKTILLNVSADGEAPELTWTPYEDWSNGVSYQEIQLKDDNGFFNTIISKSPTEFSFTDEQTVDLLDEYCYRIRAVENNTLVESYSNEDCISVPLLVWPPNSFTPNRDGVNDEFIVKGKYITSFSIQIFNRWGELMFESDDITKSWNGKYKDQLCQTGVFYFRIVAVGTKEQKEVITGTISLIR
ncbi:MAG: PKD domain-containing protein [Bacteroidetes bacterium]|nr:PKD domain-containing protein [Bacteroidota bacterium]MBT4968610.1 PKD domain-containing protein [Bacteroidota bacterium]